jgi:hypothetical protein
MTDSQLNPAAPRTSPAAARMHRYRKRRRDQLQYVRVSLHVTDIDGLIRIGLLKEEQRHDPDWLQTALLSLVYKAIDDTA